MFVCSIKWHKGRVFVPEGAPFLGQDCEALLLVQREERFERAGEVLIPVAVSQVR
jgi:hypothetical protein